MKITKNTVKGFTLIELLVVIAIIGLLSTVITTPIQNGLKKGRDAKKIGDVMAIKNALAQYATDNGGLFPATLDGLMPGKYLSNLSTATSTAPIKDKIMYVTYTTASGITGYHLGVNLEAPNTSLSSDADCMVVSGSGCGLTGVTGISFTNYGTNGGVSTSATAPTATTDFDGGTTGETPLSCSLSSSNVSTCLYDIVP